MRGVPSSWSNVDPGGLVWPKLEYVWVGKGIGGHPKTLRRKASVVGGLPVQPAHGCVSGQADDVHRATSGAQVRYEEGRVVRPG